PVHSHYASVRVQDQDGRFDSIEHQPPLLRARLQASLKPGIFLLGVLSVCYVGDYSRDSQAFLVRLRNYPADDPAFAVLCADYAMLGLHLLAALQTSPACQVHLSIGGMHHLEPETIRPAEYIPALKSLASVPCNLLYVGRGGKVLGVVPKESEGPEEGRMVGLRA